MSLVTFDQVDRPRAQLRYTTGGTLSLKILVGASQVIPSAATISVKRPGGAACTTPVSGVTVTGIDGSGTMTYALTAGNADLLPAFGDAYSPWSADWKVTYSGTDYYHTTYFDVVRSPFFGIVSQADLVNHHKDLTDSLFTNESDSQKYIELAQDEILRRFENGGYRFWLIADGEQLRWPIEHLALAKFFAARITGELNDRWSQLRDYHQREADSWYENSRYIYDINQTGDVSPDEVGRAAGGLAFRV